jgi:hypothetical protein
MVCDPPLWIWLVSQQLTGQAGCRLCSHDLDDLDQELVHLYT